MKVIAHRGVSKHKPENTLTSIQAALNIPVEAIELDVHLLSDNTGEYLVVIHDRYVDGTTNGTGRITDHSFDQLRQLDAGMGQKIPTLTETLALISGQCMVNIELKTDGLVDKVLQEIDHAIKHCGFTLNQFIVSSFDHILLLECKAKQPALSLAALIAHIPHDLAQFAVDLGVDSLNLSINCINQDIINDAKQKGLTVMVYTINTERDIRHMYDWGADAIFSDDPKFAQKVICQLAAANKSPMATQE